VKEDPPIPLAKVDCPANEALCREFGVSGYPTLKIFRNGQYNSEYDGPRSAGNLILQSIVLVPSVYYVHVSTLCSDFIVGQNPNSMYRLSIVLAQNEFNTILA